MTVKWEQYRDANGELCVRRIRTESDMDHARSTAERNYDYWKQQREKKKAAIQGYRDIDGNFYPLKKREPVAPPVAEDVYVLDGPAPPKPRVNIMPFDESIFDQMGVVLPEVDEAYCRLPLDEEDIVDPI